VDETTAFILQMALILGAARLLGEIFKRLKQPPILGELCAGILLGPSLLGWLWPAGFSTVFGEHRMLDTMSTVALILLMLLTGLETDIRVLRNLGRAAFSSSVCGLLIPFASGILLGLWLDERFVLKDRLSLALFLATAMAVSALPVLARILMDLNLSRRNFAIVALSAAVVDDAAGWIVLAAVSGLVTVGRLDALQPLTILVWLILFVLCVRYVVYPAFRWLLPRVEYELRVPGGELALILVLALLCAAATAALGIHAVFGAFAAGVLLRQCPTLKPEQSSRLESVTLALFAPMFFGLVGLHVDLTALHDYRLALLVCGVAVAGKVLGCLIGGLLGRMSGWEALAVGCGMSARGAVGLVVAKVGLDMKVLNEELFSILVGMALLTSFLAPLLLRAIARLLPLSDEEKLREKGAVPGFIPAGQLRILLPAAGGDNAVVGCHLATHLCHLDGDRCIALHVEHAPSRWWRRLFRRASPQDVNTELYFQRMRTAAGVYAPRLAIRPVAAAGGVLRTILAEVEQGYDLLFVGASGHSHPVYDPLISGLVKEARCHLVIVSGGKAADGTAVTSGGQGPGGTFQHILVPTNGSYYSDAAFEIAARYAETASARLSVLYVLQPHRHNPLLPGGGSGEVGEHMQDLMRVTLRQQFSERMRDPGRLDCMVRASDSILSGLLEEVRQGQYDLVVMGAENKSFVERLYLGQYIEAAVTEMPCTVALVIPKPARR